MKAGFLAAAIIVFATSASAALMECPATNPLPVSIAVGAGGPFGNATLTDASSVSDSSLSCGGLNFSNFQIDPVNISSAGSWSGSFLLTDANVSGGYVNLTFTTNLSVLADQGPSNNQGLNLLFTVNGGIDQVGGSVSGTGSYGGDTIACLAPWVGGCSGDATPLGYSSPRFTSLFVGVNPVYYESTLLAVGDGVTASQLTSFTISLQPAALAPTPSPEPSTIGLMAAGLILFAGRKLRAARRV